MGKTITKEIDGCENCLFAKDHTCMLSKCIQNSLSEIKTKQNRKHKPFISKKCISCSRKNIYVKMLEVSFIKYLKKLFTS
ncbi:hypothetical protein OFS03_07480 [Brachyspira hyodysenteriae]|nr:hypothetical protein [Brachyspira hyodysenteriae]MDA0063057.1 hypothetical protein [Brachyspira hyodysenteriae]MDA0096311.1 hypothetical protein [Brachyspira hyodysenteriae]